jgi:hypothetical protein
MRYVSTVFLALIFGAAATVANAHGTESFRGPDGPQNALVKFTTLTGVPVWISPGESACVRTPVKYDFSLPQSSNEKKGRKKRGEVSHQSVAASWATAKTEICFEDSRSTFVREAPEEVAEKLGYKVFFHTPDGSSKVWVNHRAIAIVRRPAEGMSGREANTEACLHGTRCFYFSEKPDEVAERLNDALMD